MIAPLRHCASYLPKALHPSGPAMSTERDLAEAIHEQIKSPESARKALDLWQHRRIGPNDLADMGAVLSAVAASAIDAVLASRQREAARDPGRWDGSILAGNNPGDTPAGTYPHPPLPPGWPRKRGEP